MLEKISTAGNFLLNGITQVGFPTMVNQSNKFEVIEFYYQNKGENEIC